MEAVGNTKLTEFATFNEFNSWGTGYFYDGPAYSHWTEEEKEAAKRSEACRIRPSGTGNAIGSGVDSLMARWIVDRLNRCAELEKLLKEGQLNGSSN